MNIFSILKSEQANIVNYGIGHWNLNLKSLLEGYENVSSVYTQMKAKIKTLKFGQNVIVSGK